jgi:hypothetical protein
MRLFFLVFPGGIAVTYSSDAAHSRKISSVALHQRRLAAYFENRMKNRVNKNFYIL